MQSAFEKVKGRQEERRDLSKGDDVKGVCQESLAVLSMGKDDNLTDVRRKGVCDEDSEIAALKKENAILKAEIDGLRATIAFLSDSTGKLPCVKCGESGSALEKGLEAKQTCILTKALVTPSAISSFPRRPVEASNAHETEVHATCEVQSAPTLAASRIVTRENAQTQPVEPVQRIRHADASGSTANVTPLCSLPGNTSRSDCAVPVEVHDSVPGSAPEDDLKRCSKPDISCTPPPSSGSRAELCAKCLPLRVGVPLLRTLGEEASQGD